LCFVPVSPSIHTCSLHAVEIQACAAKQKAEKFVRTRKQDSIHHRQVSGQLVLMYLQECTHSQCIQIQRETSRMSGSRTPLQAAAAAGCWPGPVPCDQIVSKKNQSDNDRSGDTVFTLVCNVLHRHYHVHVPGVCVLCPCITKNAHILIAYKYNVRPQGCQVREHK
jgi:hypothetical protein